MGRPRQIMCPFFREPCLREGCTAFSIRESTIETEDLDLIQLVNDFPVYPVWQLRQMGMENLIAKDPYCNALKIELPERREWRYGQANNRSTRNPERRIEEASY